MAMRAPVVALLAFVAPALAREPIDRDKIRDLREAPLIPERGKPVTKPQSVDSGENPTKTPGKTRGDKDAADTDRRNDGGGRDGPEERPRAGD
jgi:hypothetical protein